MSHDDFARTDRGADPRPDETLVADALREIDGEWDAVWILAARGGQPQLERALKLVDSGRPDERRVGAAILGRLGYDKPAFPGETVDRLVRLLEDESSDVRIEAILALGQRGQPRGHDAIRRFAWDPDPVARGAVATALSLSDRPEDGPALLALALDESLDSRDWATFAFSIRPELDDPEIREALLLRARDEVAEVRGQALIALAHRAVPGSVELIRRELGGPLDGDWAIEAAGISGDSSLVPLLREQWAHQDLRDRFRDTFVDAFRNLGSDLPGAA